MPHDALNLAGFTKTQRRTFWRIVVAFSSFFSGEWALAGCWQVHGAEVRVVQDAMKLRPAENEYGDTIYCDAIVSNAAGVLAA